MSESRTKGRHGCRGYIASRPVRGFQQPQHIQNLIIRDYASRNGLHYLLSATEYTMPGCYMVLESVLQELPKLEGIIFYSLFMLPAQPERRAQIYKRVLEAGATLHGALEGLAIASQADIDKLEDIFMVEGITARPNVPAGS